MSTVALNQQTKNAKKKKKTVSWAEGLGWKEGEEEKTRTRKAAFQLRQVGVKRQKMVPRTKEKQASWDVDKAELMYYYLIDDNMHETLAQICVQNDDAKNNLITSFMMLGMGRPGTADVESIKSALSTCRVLGKVPTNNDAHEQVQEKTGDDDPRWDAWKRHVADPYEANKEETPVAAFSLGNLLTSLAKYDCVFNPDNYL